MVTQLDLRATLSAQLTSALRRRDSRAARVLRTTLARIANAEAVPITEAPSAGALELSPQGIGRSEMPRRLVSESDVRRIALAEIDEMDAAARGYDDGGRQDKADDLRLDADVLRDVVGRYDADLGS